MGLFSKPDAQGGISTSILNDQDLFGNPYLGASMANTATATQAAGMARMVQEAQGRFKKSVFEAMRLDPIDNGYILTGIADGERIEMYVESVADAANAIVAAVVAKRIEK